MNIEEQIKNIAREELKKQLEEIKADFRAYLEKEIGEIKADFRAYLEKEIGEINEQLSDLSDRTKKLETRLDERMNLLVKLRKYTLDQLMSEYNRLIDFMRPAEKEETSENAEK